MNYCLVCSHYWECKTQKFETPSMFCLTFCLKYEHFLKPLQDAIKRAGENHAQTVEANPVKQ
jgi:hypothetical protein